MTQIEAKEWCKPWFDNAQKSDVGARLLNEFISNNLHTFRTPVEYAFSVEPKGDSLGQIMLTWQDPTVTLCIGLWKDGINYDVCLHTPTGKISHRSDTLSGALEQVDLTSLLRIMN